MIYINLPSKKIQPKQYIKLVNIIFGDGQNDTHQFTGSLFVTSSKFTIDSKGSVSGSATSTGSFGAIYTKTAGKLGVGTSAPIGTITVTKGLASAPLGISASGSYLQLGKQDYGSGGLGKFMIGFGYLDTVNTHSPAYIGFEETSTTGDTKGDLTFYTRNVTTDTAPTQRMIIDEDGANSSNLGGASALYTVDGGAGTDTVQIGGANVTSATPFGAMTNRPLILPLS